MVDLSIIEQKIKDDPEIDQSVKDTLPKEKEVRSADPAYELKLYQNLRFFSFLLLLFQAF